jgi:hypothetical protein
MEAVVGGDPGEFIAQTQAQGVAQAGDAAVRARMRQEIVSFSSRNSTPFRPG